MVKVSAPIETSAFFGAVVEVSPQPILATGLDQVLVLFNRSAEEMFGYAASEVIGEPLSKLLPERFRKAHEEREVPAFVHIGAAPRRMAERGVVYGLRKDGTEFPADVGISRVVVGEQVFLVAVLEDVSERHRQEQRSLEYNADLERRVSERTTELQAANRELERFAHSVAHDLRAPLRAIDGYSAILAEECEDGLSPEGQRYLRTVRQNARRMGELVDRLLAFARLRQVPLGPTEIDMRALVCEVAQELGERVGERDIVWSIGELPPALADLVLLRQVLVNLIENALKFTGRLQRAHIEVGYRWQDDQSVYFVRDNGAGFDMAHSAAMF